MKLSKDMLATILHEILECGVMAAGVDYDEAHDRASKIEAEFREGNHSTLEDVKTWLEGHKEMTKAECETAKKLQGQSDAIKFWTAKRDGQNLRKSGAEGNLVGEGLEGAHSIALDMLGHSPRMLAAFEAARFLVGGKELSTEDIRAALYQHDDDYETAALHAYGIPEDENGYRALRACIDLGDMDKAEEPAEVEGKEVKAVTLEGNDTADEVRRAFARGETQKIKLGGKHSKGTLVARDPETNAVWLLKPGSDGPGPAAGVGEEKASQSRREACFWHVAQLWGLENSAPRCDLLIVDGKEYAAMRLLPFTYQNLDKKAKKDPGLPARALEPYRVKGLLHKWAALDFVLGNPDRHSNNLMVNDDGSIVVLIDHGSAFAGDEFDPAFDKNSFVPGYLRAWGPNKFNALPLKAKLERMPQVSGPVREQLKDWLDDIHADRLEATLHRYGIDPRACLVRLAKLKMMASREPVDIAINKLWVTT